MSSSPPPHITDVCTYVMYRHPLNIRLCSMRQYELLSGIQIKCHVCTCTPCSLCHSAQICMYPLPSLTGGFRLHRIGVQICFLMNALAPNSHMHFNEGNILWERNKKTYKYIKIRNNKNWICQVCVCVCAPSQDTPLHMMKWMRARCIMSWKNIYRYTYCT